MPRVFSSLTIASHYHFSTSFLLNDKELKEKLSGQQAMAKEEVGDVQAKVKEMINAEVCRLRSCRWMFSLFCV